MKKSRKFLLPLKYYNFLIYKNQYHPLETYVIFCGLSRSPNSAYTRERKSESEIEQQKQNFQALLQELGEASSTQLESILARREVVDPEPELRPEILAYFK